MTVFAVLPIDREPARVYAWDGQTLRHADATRDSLPAALQQLGHSGEAVTLLLSTCDCYSVWHAGDTRGRRPEQLAYLIEPALPVPAEDLAVAAVTSAEGAMVVAARRERVLPWLEACASIGVSRVVPLTLAAAQANATPDQSGAILVGGDVVELRNGKPVAWRWGDDDTPNNIIVARGEDATEALACEWIRRSAARGGACWGDVAGALRDQPAVRRAATLGAGAGRWLMASVAVMLLSTTLALWRGAAGLDHHAEHYQAQTEQAYRRLFPRGSVPAEVPMVLRAELRRRGDSSGGSDVDALGQSLAKLLQLIPVETSAQLMEIRLDESGFVLSGDIAEHAEVDRLATALRDGFAVDPPRSLQPLDGGRIVFSIEGRRINRRGRP